MRQSRDRVQCVDQGPARKLIVTVPAFGPMRLRHDGRADSKVPQSPSLGGDSLAPERPFGSIIFASQS
jgi:hypothetical protein